MPDGSLRVRVHIALVSDFVTKGGAMDIEAAARATTVYLPEATIRMLPDPVSCEAASLIAGSERPVLTTDVTISPRARCWTRRSIRPKSPYRAGSITWKPTEFLRANPQAIPRHRTLAMLADAAERLRERRRTAGAMLMHRRETKVRVREDEIEIFLLDSNSPSRMLVAEFMVLSNFVAARFAAETPDSDYLPGAA